MAKNPQFRGLRPNPEALGVIPLAAGEKSEMFRVRGSIEVLERFKGMTAGERGAYLAVVFEKHPPKTPDSP